MRKAMVWLVMKLIDLLCIVLHKLCRNHEAEIESVVDSFVL